MHLHPYLLLTCSALFFGFNFVIGKVLVGVVPPITINLLRWILPFLLFLSFTWRELLEHKQLYLSRWPLFLLLGATGYSINNISVYKAVLYTSAVNASFISSFSPIIFAVLAFLFYREKFVFTQVLGIGLSIIGVLYIVFKGDLSMILTLTINPGDAFMLLSTLSWAIHSLILKKKGPGIPWQPLFTVLIFGGLMVNLPLAIYENLQVGLDWVSDLTLRHLIAILAASLFPSLLGYMGWNLALAKVSSNQAAIFLNLIPVFTSIMSILFLKEQIYISHLVGGLLIVSGVLLVTNVDLLQKSFKEKVAKAT